MAEKLLHWISSCTDTDDGGHAACTPPGIYLTRGDGVAVQVTAEMLAAWVAMDPAHPTSHDLWIASDILAAVAKEETDHAQ